MPDVIRFGIIGGGMMGREFAAAAARWCQFVDPVPRPVVVAVASRTRASCEWFHQNVATARQLVTDYREILSNPDVDAVYAAVPHNLHREVYIETLRCEKHLLGEKPFGMNRDDNAAILAEAAKHPRSVVRCVSQWAYFPGALRMMKYAAEKRFGRIIEVEAEYLHSSDLNPDKHINWKRQAKFCGDYGCMGDLGMHVLFIPIRAGWVPSNVRAILSNIREKRRDAGGNWVPCDTWDNATLLSEVPAPEGAFPMTLRFHRIAPGEMNSWNLRVIGERFSAKFSLKYPRTLETLSYEPGGLQVWAREDLGYESAYRTIAGSIFEFGYADAFQQMLAAYCDQVAKGPDAVLPFGCVTLEETGIQHAVLTAALESHARKGVAEVAV